MPATQQNCNLLIFSRPLHMFDCKILRQNFLRAHFSFNCNCLACEFNYPTDENTLPNANIPAISITAMAPLIEMREEYVHETIEKCVKYLKDHFNHYPCSQLARAQKILRFMTEFLFKTKPIELIFHSCAGFSFDKQ